MTAVLSPTDHFRRDKVNSMDDKQLDYASSSVDWREKYNEVADMLAETRVELDEFHAASKELEAELENELQRTEKAHQDLKIKVAKAENERDDWKSKFMTLQTNFNTTTTSLQRELDKLRQEHQHLKIQLRELEMGNDDLERNERAVTSSLADVEAKYSKALEEKILLEHELLDKANVEEELQRLKDELRDANVEVAILKDQLEVASVPVVTPPTEIVPTIPSSTSASSLPSKPLSCGDNLPTAETPRAKVTQRPAQSVLLQRAGFPSSKSEFSPSSGIARSSTLPVFGSPSASPRTPTTRRLSPVRVTSYASTNSTTSATSTATSRSKTMQMASAIRAKMENSLQKSFTRVPRLRKPSVMGRSNVFAVPSLDGRSSGKSSKSNSIDENGVSTSTVHRSIDSRRSNDSGNEKGKNKDSTGWVLIMEDSPSPPKDRSRDRRRTSSPSGRAYRPEASSSNNPSPTLMNRGNPLTVSTMNTGIKRPQSRLSGASLSTTTSTSSIPTPTSRPSTPTFLPVPIGSLYSQSTTPGLAGLKRSTGPGLNGPYSKRSSLGSTATPPETTPRERPLTMPVPPRSNSGTPSSMASSRSDRSDPGKALPRLPSLHANVTMRQSTRLPMTSSGNILAQSRIGRPSGGGGIGGRRSAGDSDGLLDLKKDTRPRAGSATALYGK
ncbi:NADH:ubiquinone oxidoreductase [Pleurotus ostreatus]|uniref:NADH:ubiquinone oxidoreductase n=2 Tax=Pleurotus ostreatus TaxID=5322 RepID=A0A8H7A2J9_PLEOS|nr:NADH:ubiquinone oxidoreductase [Pleurotus ostreatus]KAF7436937.1 NADH:ubiquinone oxidoreductase [Pleurotus ostreatus]KAJ8702753.1 NADH:ubiquinone oxidoreductase [Pleurotus ostreatus]